MGCDIVMALRVVVNLTIIRGEVLCLGIVLSTVTNEIFFSCFVTETAFHAKSETAGTRRVATILKYSNKTADSLQSHFFMTMFS